jgi:hypothetical protein
LIEPDEEVVMTLLKDRFFWSSYGKFTAAAALGCAVAIVGLGIPVNVALTLTVGAVIGFPAAFAFAQGRPPRDEIQSLQSAS